MLIIKVIRFQETGYYLLRSCTAKKPLRYLA